MSISEPTEEPLRPPGPGGTAQAESAAGKLFDLRLLIGGLFILYGVVLAIAGMVAGGAALQKAAGININLWMGIGMFVLGALFLLWRRVQPLESRPTPAPASEQPVSPEEAGQGQDR